MNINQQVYMQNNFTIRNCYAMQNDSRSIQGYMLGRYLNDAMNSSPEATKKRRALAYAAEVRARNPSMQVKRAKEIA